GRGGQSLRRVGIPGRAGAVPDPGARPDRDLPVRPAAGGRAQGRAGGPRAGERKCAPLPRLRARRAADRAGGRGERVNGWIVAIGQPVLMVVAAPLLIGWMRLIRARMEGRAGAGIGQPWRDLRKLARKEPISPADAGWLFAWAPPVLVATSLLIAAMIPLASTTSVAGGSADLIAVVGLLLLGTAAL